MLSALSFALRKSERNAKECSTPYHPHVRVKIVRLDRDSGVSPAGPALPASASLSQTRAVSLVVACWLLESKFCFSGPERKK